MAKKNKLYAVAVGQLENGYPIYKRIYDTWPECQAVISGIPGAIYKSFPLDQRKQAEDWMQMKLEESGIIIEPVSTYSLKKDGSPIPVPVSNTQSKSIEWTPKDEAFFNELKQKEINNNESNHIPEPKRTVVTGYPMSFSMTEIGYLLSSLDMAKNHHINSGNYVAASDCIHVMDIIESAIRSKNQSDLSKTMD